MSKGSSTGNQRPRCDRISDFLGARNSFRQIVDNGPLLRNKFRAPICPCEWPPKNLRCRRPRLRRIYSLDAQRNRHKVTEPAFETRNEKGSFYAVLFIPWVLHRRSVGRFGKETPEPHRGRPFRH